MLWSWREGRVLPPELAQANAMDQVHEAGIAAERVEVRMGFDELQDSGFFAKGLFEPKESLLAVIEAEVGIDKRAGWDVSGGVAAL